MKARKALSCPTVQRCLIYLSGILSSDLNGSDITAIPLKSSEVMEIGYIHVAEQPLSAVAERYLEHFRGYIEEYKTTFG